MALLVVCGGDCLTSGTTQWVRGVDPQPKQNGAYGWTDGDVSLGVSGEIETIGDIGLYRVPGSYGIYDFRTNDEFVLTDGRGRYFDNSRYNFLHAEEDQRFGYEGYWVLQESRSRYSIRHFDETGKEDDRPVKLRLPDDVIPFEPLFEADVNNDNWTGLRLIPVEDDPDPDTGPAFGSTQLHKTQSGGYALTDESYDVSLDYDPNNANAGVIPTPLYDARGTGFSNAKYTFTQAEADPDGGYWVLAESRGKYSIRHFDDDGRENARAQSLRSATELVDWEDEFDADLNSDNRVGPGYSAIEDSDDVTPGQQAYGDYQLHTKTSGGYAISTAGFDQDADPQTETPVGLTDARGKSIDSNRYTFTQAEADPDGGYWVLAESRGKYSIRHFDDDGRENARAQSLRSATELVDWEDEFDADLNSDNRVGPGYSAIEDSDDVTPGQQAYGDYQLHTKTSGGYAISTAGFDQDADPQTETPVGLTDARGNSIDSNRYTFTQAEADPDGGYWVLAESRGKYSISHFDDDGKEDARALSLRTDSDLVAQEANFSADLDDDGRLGPVLTPVENDPDPDTGPAFGSTQLHTTHVGGYAVTTEGYDVSLDVDPANNGGEIPVSLTDKRGVISAAKATFTHAEADPDGGYWVLDETRGKYTVRHFNEEGKEDQRPVKLRRPDQELSDWEDEFLADLTGEGTVGNDAPVFQTPTPVSLAEDRAISATPVATVVATSTNGIAGYEITSGNVGDAFAIDGSGNITQIAGLDFETTDAYALTIQATDTLGNTVSTTLDLTITDQNDAPEFTGGETAAVDFAENSEAVVYTAQATDEDASADVITYALGSGGGDEGLFNIDPSSGELTFKTQPDFEDAQDVGEDNVYEVQIQASDGNGGTATQSVLITVTDVGSSGFVIYGVDAGDLSGRSVSYAGDINDDGYADVIIGAPWADPNLKTEAGESYVLFGATEGFGSSVNLSSLDGNGGFTIFGIQDRDRVGYSVSAAGDVNNDGSDDFLIGAYDADRNDKIDAGEVYLLYGKSGDFGASFDLSIMSQSDGSVITGIDGDDFTGIQVSNAGDLNKDSFDDIIIGANAADPNGNARAGKTYVIFGNSNGLGVSFDLTSLDGTNGFVLNGIAPYDRSGQSVSEAGDINGDGYDDIILGANAADPNGTSSGESYVIFGKRDGFSASLNLSDLDGASGFTINGIYEGDEVGISVSTAGDFNGDGFDDLIIGAHHSDSNGRADAGQSYVIFGKAESYGSTFDLSSLNGTNGFAVSGISAGDRSGRSVSSAGDVNNDGFDDIIVGAYGANPNNLDDAGAAYVVLGKPGGFVPMLDLSLLDGSNGFAVSGRSMDDRTGWSVDSAGDINKDGYDDIIIGAYRADPNGANSGESYVVFGQSEFDAFVELSDLDLMV